MFELHHFSQVASYMKAVNNIFRKAEFDGIDVIDFKVKSMTVRSLLTLLISLKYIQAALFSSCSSN